MCIVYCCVAQASLGEERAHREAAESRMAQEKALLEEALQRELERASGLQASLLQAQKAKVHARCPPACPATETPDDTCADSHFLGHQQLNTLCVIAIVSRLLWQSKAQRQRQNCQHQGTFTRPPHM